MNARKLGKKIDLFLLKCSTFEFRTKKLMALKLFEFVEQFLMHTFLFKLTQFGKTGSMGKTFISLGNLIINFRNYKSITFFVTFTLLQFDSEFAFLLTMEMH